MSRGSHALRLSLWVALLPALSCGGGSDGGSSKGGRAGSGATDGGGSDGGGSGGSSGSPGCAAGEKTCAGKCVSTSDPAYGCASTDCAPCGSAHGQPSCAAGVCKIDCESGFGDCDHDAQNGCEATLDTAQACGSCLTPCASGNSCVSGSCQGPCGNGTLESGEECDDGNSKNLDGCDSSCRYELVMRTTLLAITAGAAPSFCTTTSNRFGEVFPTSILGLLNSQLQGSIDSGTLNLMVQLIGVDDLKGQNDSDFSMAILNGELDERHTTPWATGSIDFWFRATKDALDSQGKPLALAPGGKLTSGALALDTTALHLPFAGSTLELTAARMRASIASNPAPDVPAPPPDKLAAGLTVFRSFSADTAGGGLCGNATVKSLSQVPLPQIFTSTGLAPCLDASAFSGCSSPPTTSSHVYKWCGEHCGSPGDSDYDANGCTTCSATRCNSNPVTATCNSLLDAMVGGCVVSPPDCVIALTATQPDIGTSGNSPAALSVDTANGNKVNVAVATDAYSAFFNLAANRAHLTNNLP